MRPWTIVYFERLFAFTLVLAIPHAWLAGDFNEGIGDVFWSLGLTIVISVFLILMISRRRSKVAKWVLVAMTILGILYAAVLLSQGVDLQLSPWFAAIQFVGQIAAVALLFFPSSRNWFAHIDTTENLTDTFS